MVHVDDCTIAATSPSLIADFKSRVAGHVEITDLGELHWLLGIEVRREREAGRLFLSQCSYLKSIIRRYGFDDLKPLSIPMDPNVQLSSMLSPSTTQDFACMRDVPYHEALGLLMYAALGTRPDIAYVVQTVSRFMAHPSIEHWDAVKRIFRYLKGTAGLWLAYGNARRELVGYTDADGSMVEDCRAISGYAFLLNGGAVDEHAHAPATKFNEDIIPAPSPRSHDSPTHRTAAPMFLVPSRPFYYILQHPYIPWPLPKHSPSLHFQRAQRFADVRSFVMLLYLDAHIRSRTAFAASYSFYSTFTSHLCSRIFLPFYAICSSKFYIQIMTHKVAIKASRITMYKVTHR